MFVLTKVGEDKEKFILIPTKAVYTVGRSATDLILSEDLSISRTHLRLCLPSTGSSEPLNVIDLGSKYGTFINNDIQLNKKMLAKTQIPLQVGDKIRFGALKNIWKLSQLNFTTTPSSLSRSELEELQQLLQPLGGALLPTWTQECSHLTMDNVAVTVKLLHALLDNKPIVSVAFWRALSKAALRIHISEDWPKPEDFPPAQSLDMPSIKWNPERTKLFASKTVVFCNRKHFEMYGPVVQKAGGACKDLNSGVRRQFLTKNDVVVIQYIPSTQSQSTETIHNVQEILNQAGRRLIPDYEIGLAILHCSTDKFCNPSHVITENSLATTESMDSSILVLNTERTQKESNSNKGTATEFIVAESEIYAPSVGTDKPEKESEPDAQPAAKPQQTSRLTRNQSRKVINVDSSDEDVQLMEPSTSKKATKTMPKRKLATSDEEEQTPMQLRKISKTLPGDKSKQSSVENSVDKAAEKSELPKRQEKSMVSPTPRRLTRSNQVQQEEIQKKLPSPQRRSPRGQPAAVPKKSRLSAPLIDEASDEELPEAVPEKTKLSAPLIDEASDEELPFQFKSRTPAVQSQSSQNSQRMKLTMPQSDEDSEEEQGLFQFKKTQPAATGSSSNATDKPMPSGKANPPAKISVRNFLEKSQNPINPSQTVAATQPRKRLRLEQLNESDSDDNENLFKFANSKKQKKSFGNDSADGEMFNFKSQTQKEQQGKVDSDDSQNSISTEPFIANIRAKSKYIMPKPMEQRKINISGWLSCSGLHEDIKPKAEQMDAETAQLQIKEEQCDVKDEHLKWIASMKDSIQIRMCNLNISVRSHDESKAVDTTDGKYSGRKNFKKFVKKPILHPQHRIVELKRMQLAEGMVKVL